MVGRALVALSLLAACGGEPASAEPPPPTPEPPQFRAQAHREAWARLPALAEAALVASDPLARAQLDDDAPVDLPPHGAGAIIDARRVLDSAWREAKDLDAALLEPEARALLRAIRFALSRARDGLSRRPPARTDPNVIVTELDEALTILAARGTECTACDAARERAAAALRDGIAALGACSSASLAHARTRLDAHATALATATPTAGTRALGLAIDDARGRLSAIAAALPQAAPAAWGDPLAAAAAPSEVRRLPDRLGASELRRRLDTEEAHVQDARASYAALSRALTQLSAMLAKHPVTTPVATAVDRGRCESRWVELQRYIAGQPTLQGAALDCASFVDDLGVHSDAELTLALVEAGIVTPVERARRAAVTPTLGLVRGRIAPRSHRDALAIAVTSGLRDADARALVVARARDAVCVSLAALWIHGELGDDATLRGELFAPVAAAPGAPASPRCGDTTIDSLIATAQADPRAALGAMGLTLLALGPADVVALENFWWLPYGLVVETARPADAAHGGAAPVDSKTEELRP